MAFPRGLIRFLPTKVQAWLIPQRKRLASLSRTACLGTFTYQHLDAIFDLRQHYKNRVDYELECTRSPGQRAEPEDVIPFLARQDLADIIRAQSQSLFAYKRLDCFFMDSFSELTDQLFSREDKSSFLAHYSDINHTEKFENRYASLGLLDLEDLHQLYRDFFARIVEAYGPIPIFFMHYSTKFDDRELFKARAQKIKDCVEALAAKDFSNLYSIALPDALIERMPNNDFPYHYAESTYQEFARAVKAMPAYAALASLHAGAVRQP